MLSTNHLMCSCTLVIACLAQLPPPTQPFCGYDSDRTTPTLTFACSTPGAVIDSILFASYGTPFVGPSCVSYAANSSCNAPQSLAVAEAACLGKSECVISYPSGLPDPCPGIVKTAAVVANCSLPPGGYNIHIVKSCATAGAPDAPACPPPTWAPTWQLNRSTLCNAAGGGSDGDGFLNATQAARFGLVCLDWAVAQGVWNPPGATKYNMTGGSTLVEQCRRILAADPTTKCMVYRNAELALGWQEEQRAIMYDPAYAGFFVQYQPGNPGNVTPGTIYNEPGGCSGCDQYFFNYSNASALEWALSVSEMGPLGTGSPYVVGTFLDDTQGFSWEHPHAPNNTGIGPVELAVLQNATQAFTQQAIDRLQASGAYLWQALQTRNTGDPDYFGLPPSSGGAGCTSWMQTACALAMQDVPLTLRWPYNSTWRTEALAMFLIARGPYAWVGQHWPCMVADSWDPMFDTDVGEPIGLCSSPAPSVFTRQFSRGEATMNCTSFQAQLTFTNPPGVVW